MAQGGDKFRGVKEKQAKKAKEAKRQRAAVAEEIAAKGFAKGKGFGNRAERQQGEAARGHVHEDTLKLLVTLVHEDNAFVVSSAAKRSPRERDSGAKTSPAVVLIVDRFEWVKGWPQRVPRRYSCEIKYDSS